MNELLGTYFINAIKMWFPKQMALNAEVSFNTFGKELGLLGVGLGSLATYFKRRIATSAFSFKEICYLTPWI